MFGPHVGSPQKRSCTRPIPQLAAHLPEALRTCPVRITRAVKTACSGLSGCANGALSLPQPPNQFSDEGQAVSTHVPATSSAPIRRHPASTVTHRLLTDLSRTAIKGGQPRLLLTNQNAPNVKSRIIETATGHRSTVIAGANPNPETPAAVSNKAAAHLLLRIVHSDASKRIGKRHAAATARAGCSKVYAAESVKAINQQKCTEQKAGTGTIGIAQRAKRIHQKNDRQPASTGHPSPIREPFGLCRTEGKAEQQQAAETDEKAHHCCGPPEKFSCRFSVCGQACPDLCGSVLGLHYPLAGFRNAGR